MLLFFHRVAGGNMLARGIWSHIVAVGRKGSGPASTADSAIFANAAVAFKAVEVSKFFKKRPGRIDFIKGSFADIAGDLIKIAAGLDIAMTADEGKTVSGHAASPVTGQFAPLLREDTGMMRGTGNLHRNLIGLAMNIGHPFQNPFDGFAIQLCCGISFNGAARGHNEKEVPGGRPKTLGHCQYFREVVGVGRQDGGIDLKGNLFGLEPLKGLHDVVEGPFFDQKLVLFGGIGGVKAEAEALDPGLFQGGHAGRGQQLAVIAGDNHGVAQFFPMSDQFFEVLADERFTAGNDDDTWSDAGGFGQQFFAFSGGEFACFTLGYRRSAAMGAGKATSPGGFPGQQMEFPLLGPLAAVGVTLRVSVWVAGMTLTVGVLWMHEDQPFNQRAAGTAKYVRIISAPARLMAIRLSRTAARSSIQPLAAAALIIEYSPET